MSEDLTKKLREKLVADIAELQTTLATDTHEINHSLRDLFRGQTVLNDAILKVHIDLLDIHERLTAIEGPDNQQNSQT